MDVFLTSTHNSQMGSVFYNLFLFSYLIYVAWTEVLHN